METNNAVYYGTRPTYGGFGSGGGGEFARQHSRKLLAAVVAGALVCSAVVYGCMLLHSSSKSDSHTAVSGKRGTVGASKSSASAADAHMKMSHDVMQRTVCGKATPGSKCVTNLTPCPPGMPCQDVATVSPADKKIADAAVVQFLKDNPSCMVMIYAHWCGHCHNAMPEFMEASTEASIPFAIINSDMVSPELLQGDTAVFDVQFYPYIVKRETTGSEVSDTVFKQKPPLKENFVEHAGLQPLDHFFA